MIWILAQLAWWVAGTAPGHRQQQSPGRWPGMICFSTHHSQVSLKHRLAAGIFLREEFRCRFLNILGEDWRILCPGGAFWAGKPGKTRGLLTESTAPCFRRRWCSFRLRQGYAGQDAGHEGRQEGWYLGKRRGSRPLAGKRVTQGVFPRRGDSIVRKWALHREWEHRC